MTRFPILNTHDLHKDFKYPDAYLRVLKSGLTNLEPWFFLDAQGQHTALLGLRQRYPLKDYIPFVRRQDNDDIACFALNGSHIVIVHGFASSGWEHRFISENFYDSLNMAVSDFIKLES